MKGILPFFLVFTFLFIFLVMFFAIIIPLGINFTASSYSAGETILNNTNVAEFSPEVQETINTAKATAKTNIEMLTFFFRYSWIIIIIAIVIVIILLARQQGEYPV